MLEKMCYWYNGYNLLFGDINLFKVYNNVNNLIYIIDIGVYGLFNVDIVIFWLKVM